MKACRLAFSTSARMIAPNYFPREGREQGGVVCAMGRSFAQSLALQAQPFFVIAQVGVRAVRAAGNVCTRNGTSHLVVRAVQCRQFGEDKFLIFLYESCLGYGK